MLSERYPHFPAATHEIKDFDRASPFEREQVVLHGYTGPRTDLSKNLAFVPLLSRDLTYSIQIVSSAKGNGGRNAASHEKLKSLESNSPVAIKGFTKSRVRSTRDGYLGFKRINDVEIELEDIFPLNQFPKDIIVTADTVFPPEQRHLQMRTDKSIRDSLRFRAKAVDICREELKTQDFLELETPLLFKSTPEGAREFLVPTRRKGFAYALPQSPQQYKQILMASGFSRYFQFAKCFRDEDQRADRQPEFTQLDLEMSFATAQDIMNTMEKLLRRLWNKMLPEVVLPNPFPIIKYQEAMSKYGSDKPDLRLGMEINRIDHMIPVDLVSKIGPLVDPIVEVLKLSVAEGPKDTREFVTKFMDSPAATDFIQNPEGQPGVFIFDSRQPLSGLQPFGFEAAEQLEDTLDLKDGDLIVIQARKKTPHLGEGSTQLGNLRLALHRSAVAQGYIPAPTGFQFTWVRDFPLFSPSNDTDPGQGGSAGLSATHHPFTSPKTAEDVDKLLTAPSEVTGDHYDIVVNGVELGGGSRRIHSAQVQEFILREVLKMTDEGLDHFKHLLEVLRAGCPPHAGIALGFDRLVAVMLGKDSVRDVIAFPKNGKGEDLLVKSPGAITSEALETYHLKLKD
ncbi:MAG: hypothetical protein M1834_003583 [Cirrosporium novae-zelandiae]|nr:MAG: hypothetical protein M1834_003583 [Cirrosporium novae-zelandiae]